MLIYILLFITTSLLFYLAQELYKRSVIAFYILSYVAIFLLAFVAGCRDNNIGTDIGIYGEKTFLIAKHSKSILKGLEFNTVEPLFFLIDYLSSLISSRYGVALFSIMFIQSIFAFYGFKRYMKYVPLWLCFLTYNLAFYNLSYNLMRQGIAVCFLFMCFTYVEKKQGWQMLVSFIVAYFFHKSTLIPELIFIAIYRMLAKDINSQKIFIIKFAIITAISVVSFGAVILAVTNAIPAIQRYSAYVGNSSWGAHISIPEVGIKVSIIALVLFLYNKVTEIPKYKVNILLIFLIADLACVFLGMYADFTSRFGFYFQIFTIPYLYMVIMSSRVENNTRNLICFSILAIYLFKCIFFNFYLGNNETYPYTSKFLGI